MAPTHYEDDTPMDYFDAVLQNDTILASQWTDMHARRDLSGEQRLCLGILRDGLLNLTKPTGKPMAREMRRQDALQWLMGAKDCYMRFDFVCAALGVDAQGFRERLLRALDRYHGRTSKTRNGRVRDERSVRLAS